MTKRVKIGNIEIGGGNRIAVQSMCDVKTSDVKACLIQAERLCEVGCDILRFAVMDEADCKALKTLKRSISIPMVADIHFDWRLAVAAIDAGVDKVRINPGNLGGTDKLIGVIRAAKDNGAAIRIGVNGGSADRAELERTGNKMLALLNSLRNYVTVCENEGFDSLVLSAKLSSVKETVYLNRMLSNEFDYPLHIGVTEAGVFESGSIKNAIGIGALLVDGIGDTLRVSLTDDPVKEVIEAKKILAALRLSDSVEVISCPTCGRTRIDIKSIANAVSRHVEGIERRYTVAVMGCAVNGPGEAKDADLGLAGGDGEAVFFRKGAIFKKVRDDILNQFLAEIDRELKPTDATQKPHP